MTTTLNDTPNANRIHIGFFGKCNSGKSSLLNAFTGQEVAIVSKVAGTTTDPVYKAMEINGIGACVLIDTAGFNDDGELGRLRMEKTKDAADKTEIAILLFSGEDISQELMWYDYLKQKNIKIICVVSKCDQYEQVNSLVAKLKEYTKEEPVRVSVKLRQGIEELRDACQRLVHEEVGVQSIVGSLVKKNDLVVLVMPQDIQAPKGRLILPQVQTIRDLLDHKCVVISTTMDGFEQALAVLVQPPQLIITDSQVFQEVYEKKPETSLLTSFSVLFSKLKGNLPYYIEGAKAIATLTPESRVLIAECCTHAPLSEDIGREKIPKMLRKKIGETLDISIVSGSDFPKDLSEYDLIIQCGACMFNRQYVLSRIERAKGQNIPMTNYGIVIAYLKGILDKITY